MVAGKERWPGIREKNLFYFQFAMCAQKKECMHLEKVKTVYILGNPILLTKFHK